MAILDALQESVEAGGKANVSTACCAPFVELIPKLWQEIEQRSLERTEAAQNEDFDEEEVEVMLQGGETDQEMQETIVLCMGGFFKTFGAEFFAVFQQTGVAQHCLTWLVSRHPSHMQRGSASICARSQSFTLRPCCAYQRSDAAVQRWIALCVFCDIVEFCGESSSAPLAQHFLPGACGIESPAGCRRNAMSELVASDVM
jgi:hypothetical protein